jgi:hypothetical protein
MRKDQVRGTMMRAFVDQWMGRVQQWNRNFNERFRLDFIVLFRVGAMAAMHPARSVPPAQS